MRVLIDECLPKQLKGWLYKWHQASTVQEMGWVNVKNGKLLRLANDSAFEVFVTADKNMYYQQNFDGLTISAIVIPSNFKPFVQKSVSALLQSLEHVQPGQKVVMDLSTDADTWESLRLHSIEQQQQHTTHKFKSPDMMGR